MSTTLRWGLAMAAVGIIGLGLLLLGVALGRATGGVAGYEPVNATHNIYGPANTSSGPGVMELSTTLAPERSAGVNGSFGSEMMGPGIIDRSSVPDTMGPGAMDGNYHPDMMDPGVTHTPGRGADADRNFGSDMMGPGTVGRDSRRGMMGPGMMGH